MKPTTSKPEIYRTIFMCTLEQRTALSNGGTDEDSPWDMPLTLDGEGQPVLRGRSLAGALVATARTFLDVPPEISICPEDLVEFGRGSAAHAPSLWEVWNGRLFTGGSFTSSPPLEVRVGNAVRHDTRASASKALLDVEVLPRGGLWRFLLEVRHPSSGAGDAAAAVAALALSEWTYERCWLGRKVARGLGWCRLQQCEVLELPRTESAVDSWPDSSLRDLGATWKRLTELQSRKVAPQARTLSQCLNDAQFMRGAPRRSPVRAFVRWTLSLEAGPYIPEGTNESPGDRVYGLDAISVGGHDGAMVEAAEIGDEHLLRAGEQPWESFATAFDPDFMVATCPVSGGGLSRVEPFVPGSAIAGAWRHPAARAARRDGEAVLDPSTGQRYGRRGQPAPETIGLDSVTALFGHASSDAEQPASLASSLLVSDAHMALSAKDWKMALLEKCSLSEFDQSALSGAKFNRTAVTDATWNFEVVQTIDLEENWEHESLARTIGQAVAPMQSIIRAGELRRIGVGGGEFRGYGHGQLIVRACEWSVAGQPWTKGLPSASMPGDAHG